MKRGDAQRDRWRAPGGRPDLLDHIFGVHEARDHHPVAGLARFGEHGVKYVLVSDNTKLGAAKGAVLTAEVLVTTGYM